MNNRNNLRKWRNLLIHNDIQWRLGIYNFIFLLFVIGVVISTALVPLYAGFQNSDNLLDQYFSAKFFIVIIERSMVAFIGIVIFGFVYHVIITHRFCGPLANFGKTFHKIKQGDLTHKVFLRRNDFLKQEANQINGMIDALSIHLDNLKQYNHLMRKKVEKLLASNHKLAQSEPSLLEIKTLVDACGKTLDQFTTAEISHRKNQGQSLISAEKPGSKLVRKNQGQSLNSELS